MSWARGLTVSLNYQITKANGLLPFITELNLMFGCGMTTLSEQLHNNTGLSFFSL